MYRRNDRVQKEMDSWPSDLSLKLVCELGGAVLAVRRHERYGVTRLHRVQRADITMRFNRCQGRLRY